LRPVLARTGSGRRLDLFIIVLIVLATTKNLAPEALFLFVLVLSLGLGRILGHSGRLPLSLGRVAAYYIRRRRGRSWLRLNAKNSLKNVAMGRLLSGLGRLGTID
jgi:hypothetical protein